MSEQSGRLVASPASHLPETSALLLATFADLYRQEVSAEEDVHRTLPFFGTALGIVIAALAYAAGRLPRWSELATVPAMIAFSMAAVLLALAIIEAGCVLVWVSRAIKKREYRRIGPEPALRARLDELRSFYNAQDVEPDRHDKNLAEDMRVALLESYASATPENRRMNERRYEFRARASLHLIRSLIWALGATSIIFVADKMAYLPKAVS